MIVDFFSTFIYDPLYNGLVFFISIVPGGDVGLAVILLTIFVKFILFPLSLKAVRTQMVMREIEEPLKELQEKYKEDKQKQAQEIMALYREKGINPFSSILLLFIQIPIIFGLYWVFFKGGLPEIDTELLYSFVQAPSLINMMFLGIIDMGGRDVILALLAGITQYIQAKYSLPEIKPRDEKTASFKDDLARSFQVQIRYVLPVIVFVISYTISAAIALYWTTSNIFSILQEWYVRKNIRKEDTGAAKEKESEENPKQPDAATKSNE